LVISGVAIALYMAFLFTTGGRLVIAALVFTGVVLAAGRLKTNAFKALVVVGLIPALLAAARQRASVISTTRGVQESGLESVIWPMDRLSLLLSMSHGGQLPPSGGDTLWSTAVFWFPRSLWPEKPNGFGADLTAAIRPDLVGTGHSEAATLLGEWVWDFGIWSLFALPLVAALCLVLLRKLRDATPGFASRDLRVSMHLTSALATAGMLDVFWIGTFGFASRTGQRLIIIALFAIVLARTPRARASRDQDTSRTASRNRRKGRGARVHAGARQPSTPPAAHGTL